MRFYRKFIGSTLLNVSAFRASALSFELQSLVAYPKVYLTRGLDPRQLESYEERRVL